MTAEKLFPSGAWRISAIIGDHLKSRVYIGYTKREAMADFRAEFLTKRKG
jgi:hypothetical protein